MTHPDPERNKYQREFLEKCPPEERRFHELMFKVGNATYRYHQEVQKFNASEDDWKEWLNGLDEPMKKDMQNKGFDYCKTIFSFTRYVNEKNDLGLEDYLKKNISQKDLDEYHKLLD